MILTTCAACAAPLAHTAPRCVRCHTRYCNQTCQHDHWRRGHKQICKKIHRGGNAEQYYADKKYKEAVAVAVEACADDTKGQTCFICTEAVHPRTGEGLVRGCACGDRDGVASGSTGVAHVSCLAEQAKVLVAEVEKSNISNDAKTAKWALWHTCSLCQQDYHGVVRCALGWACWKTYLSRPETDQIRGMAMTQLGTGLSAADHDEDALSVQEALLSTMKRLGASKGHILVTEANLAVTYEQLGRYEQALQMKRDVYSGTSELYGEENRHSLGAARNYAAGLVVLHRYAEAKSWLRKQIPMASRVMGNSNAGTLIMKKMYAMALYKGPSATFDDLRESVATLEDTERIARRVLGGAHPIVVGIEKSLREARGASWLRAREAPV